MRNILNYSGQKFYTSGQVAKRLRISVSTLKRWISDDGVVNNIKLNSNGWKLFSINDIHLLKDYQRQKRKNGKRFSPSILRPVEK